MPQDWLRIKSMKSQLGLLSDSEVIRMALRRLEDQLTNRAVEPRAMPLPQAPQHQPETGIEGA
jgi:hypothetical protein